MRVRDVMAREVVTLKEEAPLEVAVKVLHERHIGSIVVTDLEEKCAGIFTERDAIRAMATRIPLGTSLRDVMTRNVITIWEGASFREAKRLFCSHGLRHIPVVDDQNRLVGMFSVRMVLDEFMGV